MKLQKHYSLDGDEFNKLLDATYNGKTYLVCDTEEKARADASKHRGYVSPLLKLIANKREYTGEWLVTYPTLITQRAKAEAKMYHLFNGA